MFGRFAKFRCILEVGMGKTFGGSCIHIFKEFGAISIEYFFNHNYHRKTGVKGWVIFRQTMQKCYRDRNEIWDFFLIKITFSNLSYLGTITWKAIPALHALSFHPVLHTVDSKDGKNPSNYGKFHGINWKVLHDISSIIIITELPSSNGKISCSIRGSVIFLHC